MESEKNWNQLNDDLVTGWHWMEHLDQTRRSDAVLALGAGLPRKVLMSR